MPPAKKRKTATRASTRKKNHVVTATTSPPPESVEEAEQQPQEEPGKQEPEAPVAEKQAEPEQTRPSPAPETAAEPEPEPDPTPVETVVETTNPLTAAAEAAPTTTTEDTTSLPPANPLPSSTLTDRMARFRALQSRAKTSSASNLTAARTEAHRLTHDPTQLTTVQRKSATAAQKLLKADIEDAGGDFERKRAWDWTVDESERWDERMRERAAHRDDNAFSDYRREANKVYERQVGNLGAPDLERYTAEKMRAIEAAARRGTLELVETEDGEMVAVDKDGTFYGGGGGSSRGDIISSFVDNKPDKKAVDRLVGEMKKAEDVAAKKRKERAARNGDDADVTYINDKNKQFNQKLARFYNKYTAEIRDSFERGTMI
ncbi:SYF2 splicing factor-domain-containing protein [Coniella lustricola]|uniref:Pre-mRNA-splicing factor SYF2 n=1 Tax=Coniella lustricola TaxID=2025994 RepID=A0A2T3AE75_9PEZI|nr:SYF2 splicing factor-domain-containing protein [Coniella lustricola]